MTINVIQNAHVLFVTNMIKFAQMIHHTAIFIFTSPWQRVYVKEQYAWKKGKM